MSRVNNPLNNKTKGLLGLIVHHTGDNEDAYGAKHSSVYTYFLRLKKSQEITQSQLLIDQAEYEALKKIVENNAYIKQNKENEAWFRANCFVTGLITPDFYKKCIEEARAHLNSGNGKEVFSTPFRDVFISSDPNYASDYECRFTEDKVSFEVNGLRKEIEADVVVNLYNEKIKNKFSTRASFVDLLRLKNPAEQAAFKKAIFEVAPKLIEAKLDFLSDQPSRSVVFNCVKNEFLIQKGDQPTELKAQKFLADFKEQYLKNRPWYAGIVDFFGRGTLNKLKAQPSDEARVEYLLNHANDNVKSTTATSLKNLFQRVEYGGGEAFKFVSNKKQEERKLNERNKDITDVDDVIKEASFASSTTFGRNENGQFGLYQKTELLELEAKKTRANILAEREAEGFFQPELTKATESARSESSYGIPSAAATSALDSSIHDDDPLNRSISSATTSWSTSFPRSSGKSDSVSSTPRSEVSVFSLFSMPHHKQAILGQLKKDLEQALKPLWDSVNNDQRNVEKYIEASNVGVFQTHYFLNFYDKKIASLASFITDDANIAKHRWIQAMRILYTKFDDIRDSGEADINSKIADLLRVVNQFTQKGVLTERMSLAVGKAYGNYLNNTNMPPLAPSMRR